MNYNCLRCGRLFACEETISFCPFCGQAYMGVVSAAQTMNQRIVIGSDSERTVQEKYWKSAQSAISSVLMRLRRSLPRFVSERDEDEIKVPEKYKLPVLKLRDLKILKNSTSISMFKAQLEDYLEKLETSCRVHDMLMHLKENDLAKMRKTIVKRRLSFELGEWSIEDLEDEYAINVEREANFINGICSDLAEIAGSQNPNHLQPELIYDPDKIDWVELMKDDKEWDSHSAITDEHKALLSEIRNSIPALMSAINQNSLFVLSAMQFDVDAETSPAMLAQRLKDLEEKDYDPIFGEPPEYLVEAFSDAVVYMTNTLNSLPDYKEVIFITGDRQLQNLKEKLDSVKLDSLYGLIEAWAVKLSQELDRLYQGQSENMVDVYNIIEELKKARLE